MYFVAYRDNALFREYVPKIIEGLRVAGTFVIPAGENPTDHKDAFLAAVNRAREQGVRNVISDTTCENAYFAFTQQLMFPTSHAPTLDRVFGSQVQHWLESRTAEENLVWFAEQVARGREVNTVVVAYKSIHDHFLVGTGYGLVERVPDLRVKAISKTLLDRFGCRTEVVLGVPELLLHASNSKALLVADRHLPGLKNLMGGGAGYNSLANWPHAAMLYVLPFETTAAQLIDRGDFPFEFNIEEMRKQLR